MEEFKHWIKERLSEIIKEDITDELVSYLLTFNEKNSEELIEYLESLGSIEHTAKVFVQEFFSQSVLVPTEAKKKKKKKDKMASKDPTLSSSIDQETKKSCVLSDRDARSRLVTQPRVSHSMLLGSSKPGFTYISPEERR